MSLSVSSPSRSPVLTATSSEPFTVKPPESNSDDQLRGIKQVKDLTEFLTNKPVISESARGEAVIAFAKVFRGVTALRQLLADGATISDAHRLEAIGNAAREGNVPELEYLLGNGSEPRLAPYTDMQALGQLVEAICADTQAAGVALRGLTTLLKQPIPSASIKVAIKALIAQPQTNRSRELRELLNHRDISSQDKSLFLMMAASHGNEPAVGLFLELGVTPESTATAARVAVQNTHWNICALLIRKHPIPPENRTSLALSCHEKEGSGNKDILPLLLQNCSKDQKGKVLQALENKDRDALTAIFAQTNPLPQVVQPVVQAQPVAQPVVTEKPPEASVPQNTQHSKLVFKGLLEPAQSLVHPTSIPSHPVSAVEAHHDDPTIGSPLRGEEEDLPRREFKNEPIDPAFSVANGVVDDVRPPMVFSSHAESLRPDPAQVELLSLMGVFFTQKNIPCPAWDLDHTQRMNYFNSVFESDLDLKNEFAGFLLSKEKTDPAAAAYHPAENGFSEDFISFPVSPEMRMRPPPTQAVIATSFAATQELLASLRGTSQDLPGGFGEQQEALDPELQLQKALRISKKEANLPLQEQQDAANLQAAILRSQQETSGGDVFDLSDDVFDGDYKGSPVPTKGEELEDPFFVLPSDDEFDAGANPHARMNSMSLGQSAYRSLGGNLSFPVFDGELGFLSEEDVNPAFTGRAAPKTEVKPATAPTVPPTAPEQKPASEERGVFSRGDTNGLVLRAQELLEEVAEALAELHTVPPGTEQLIIAARVNNVENVRAQLNSVAIQNQPNLPNLCEAALWLTSDLEIAYELTRAAHLSYFGMARGIGIALYNKIRWSFASFFRGELGSN